MSTRNDIAAHRRELPEISVAAPATTVNRPRRRILRRTLALVGAVGMAAAIVAPTGAALVEPQVAVAAEGGFDEVLAQAQNITIAADAVGAFTPLERSAFTVYVKPKPKPKPVAQTASGSTTRSSGGGLPRYTGGGSKAEWMAAAGIAESDWGYVDYIVRRESSWNPNATNKTSGACGLVQALPCSKVPGNGYNPVDNLRWADGYAKGRYGSWANAYNFWTRNHWW